MKKCLYISNISPYEKMGAGTLTRLHYEMIQKIQGDMLISMFVTCDYVEDATISIQTPQKKSRIIAQILRYPSYLTPGNIRIILNTIKKENIEIVYIDNSVSGKLFKTIKKRFPKILCIAFFHDIEKKLMREQMKHTKIKNKISKSILIYNEELTVKYADKLIVLNGRDSDLLNIYYGVRENMQIPIVVGFKGINYEETHEENSQLKILFVGVKYLPNINGIKWFVRDVLQLLDDNVKLCIVGRNMEEYRQLFSFDKRVEVVGTVNEIASFYQNADIVVGPIFEGGGMKVKTAEAFSYGKAYVGTKESLEGYWEKVPDDLKNNVIFNCNTKESYANTIKYFQRTNFDKNNKKIYDWAFSEYSYDANIKKMEQALTEW